MNFRRQNKKKIVAFFLLPTFLIVLFVFNYKTEGSLSATLRSLATPLWSIDIGTLFKNDNLSIEVERLRKELDNLRDLKYENLFLRAQNSTLLSLASVELPQNSRSHNVAQVSSVAGIVPYGTLHISTKGFSAEPGALVLGARAIALGNISSTSRASASVRLFSAAGRSTEVVIAVGEPAISARAMGVGNGNFVISVVRDAKVKVGDPVFASSALGYPIAIVGEVERDPADAFMLVRARVPFNIQTMRSVLVE